ncbi:Uncharacterized protein TCM_046688 [Theobroma cacao]|uniref:Uncharacterized protein n=1 Tax=Theobroma cacao TaxID=3641 RepID=A0A061DKI8_THECC|nr:Uncharacterized protein TCM_046688 [Theobroma cacao]
MQSQGKGTLTLVKALSLSSPSTCLLKSRMASATPFGTSWECKTSDMKVTFVFSQA